MYKTCFSTNASHLQVRIVRTTINKNVCCTRRRFRSSGEEEVQEVDGVCNIDGLITVDVKKHKVTAIIDCFALAG